MRREAATLEAMRDGADVIFQATFFDGRWRGHADFLFKRADRPSPASATWSYDIADTKLARSVKAGAILQMCVYADLLEGLQGIAPEWLYVITGDRRRHAHRLDDFAAYFRYVRAGSTPASSAGLADGPPAPTPTRSTTAGSAPGSRRASTGGAPTTTSRSWPGCAACDTERLDGRRRPDPARLAAAPRDRRVPDMHAPDARPRSASRPGSSSHERGPGELLFELIEPDPDDRGRGLRALPEPSPWDLFFDIEADPWATEVGLEYLLGIVEEVDGAAALPRHLGHLAEEEKAAFERFIDLVIERLDAHPEMHVYHYGGYEAGAIKRLMQRHGTRVDEVDRLLRGDVLVDLLNVVRQGVRASVESYSLKQIEKFYMPDARRAGHRGRVQRRRVRDVAEATATRRSSTGSPPTTATTASRPGCSGTGSRTGARRRSLAGRSVAGTGRSRRSRRHPTALNDWLRAVEERVAGLTERPRAGRPSPEAEGRRLLADLLDWHRREEKSQWWRWFELKDDLTIEQLVNERDALAGLDFVDQFEGEGVMLHRRYRFQPQDHGFDPGDEAFATGTGKAAGTIVAIDDAAGLIELKRSRSIRLAAPGGPDGTRAAPEHPAAAGDAAGRRRGHRGWLATVTDPTEPSGTCSSASRHAASAGWGARWSRRGEDVLDAARRLALELDAATLPIQGPPGTGKTYAGRG